MLPKIHAVLVPLDLGEDRNIILQWAVDSARQHRAGLVLLHVLPHLNAFPTPLLIDPMTCEDDLERARDAAKRSLEPLAAYARAMGIDTSTRVRVGDPADEILEEIIDSNCGLVVLGTHGRRGLAHLVLGSTAEKVVRLAPCPVFVVKAPRVRREAGAAAASEAQPSVEESSGPAPATRGSE